MFCLILQHQSKMSKTEAIFCCFTMPQNSLLDLKFLKNCCKENRFATFMYFSASSRILFAGKKSK